MKWRFIPYSENSAALNMAIDQSIMEHLQKKKSMPTIRFYSWQPSAVTIGYFQSLNEEVDAKEAQKQGVDVVRRITGGGAVYHDREGEVTYSILAPEELFEKDIIRSYAQICTYIINALKELGIHAEFRPINDLIVAQRKISGNAQTRRGKILLQHGTILYDVNPEKMFSILKVSKEKVSDKYVQSVMKVVTSVKNERQGMTKQQLIDTLKKHFLDGKEFEEGTLTESERKRAEELVASTYSSDDWNDCRR